MGINKIIIGPIKHKFCHKTNLRIKSILSLVIKINKNSFKMVKVKKTGVK
jgi:hypothetical protein